MPSTSRRPGHRTGLVLLLALLALGLVPSASLAQARDAGGTVTLSRSDDAPAAGSPVTFSATPHSDCGAGPYTFTVDGTTGAPQTSRDLTTTFATAGTHTVSVAVSFFSGGSATPCGDQPATGTMTVDVLPAPSGTIVVRPDPAVPGQPATLSVVDLTGGRGGPYTGFRWSVDGVADPAGTARTYTRTFTEGTHAVQVTFQDAGDPPDQPGTPPNPRHTGVVSRTIDVRTPAPTPTTTATTATTSTTPTTTPAPAPAPAPGTPAPTPAPTTTTTTVPGTTTTVTTTTVTPTPGCTSTVAFALSELRTSGCFDKVSSNPDRWQTTDQVRLNGIPFSDSGQRFTVTGPTRDALGGRIQSSNASIELDQFVPFSGDVDWELPAGAKGDEGALQVVRVPDYARLFELKVPGTIAIRLGYAADGRHYARFPLNVELPPAFTAGPSASSGGVSGAASISVDDAGVHFDGLKVSVQDAWLGKLKVPEACFSYVAAGGRAGEPCPTPELDGAPFLQCATDVTTDRFDGSAVVELPTASKTQLAAFGGLAGGQVSKLGGFVDDLGTTVPIVPGVFLNRVGVGVCLTPPPLKLRGVVGIAALNSKLAVNGGFTYTDATDDAPWRIDLDGNAAFDDIQLGTARVGFNAWGDVDFDVNAAIALKGVASINGEVGGWIEPRNSTFNIGGTVQGCIGSLPCATASGLVSSSGVAGCLDLGTFTVPLPGHFKQGPFFGSVTFVIDEQTITLRSGVGYRYGGSVDLLGSSCDFAPYSAVASPAATRAGGAVTASGTSTQVRPGTKAVALRVHGTNGPPKIVVRGPGGATIASPQAGTALQEPGRYLLAENPSDGTTSVLLIKPAAGTWSVEAAPGATSTPTGVDRSAYEAPPVLFGQLRRAGGGREVAVQYAVPRGASVRLVERGRGIASTIARSVRGGRCAGTKQLPDGRRVLCARVRFRPSQGPGGTRQVQALVTRDGMPLARTTLATFRAAKPARPSKPGALRARRVGRSVVVAFPASRGASRLTATAQLGDGRRLGFDLAATCRAVRIPRVAAGDAVRFQVAGVRYDLVTGRYARIALAKGRKAAGPRGTLPRRTCG